MEVNVVLLLIGIVFFVGGILMLLKELKSKKNNTVPAAAMVTGYDTEVHHDAQDDTESIVYYPMLRYEVSGQRYEQRSSAGRGKKIYEVGQQVDILYNPQHPEQFTIAGDKTPMILSVVATVIGIGIVLLAFFG